MLEPIDYDQALRELQSRRTRRRISSALRRVRDPRPTSPGQILLLGVALVALGWLLPFAHVTLTAGLVCLFFGFVTSMIEPKGRVVTWRNRQIDLPPDDTLLHRIYHLIYRRKI